MEKEDKDLLLKDLCSRLPYGVKCQVREGEYTYIGTLCRIEVDNKNGYLLDFAESISGLDCQVNLSEIKPYLFPPQSLPQAQKEEICKVADGMEHGSSAERWDALIKFVDLMHKYHVDYRGLIPLRLAKDASNLNIY